MTAPDAAPDAALDAALDAAYTHVGCADRAIEAMLTAWRLVPAASIAAQIDELARRIPRPLEQVSRRKRWRALLDANTTVSVPRLLAALDMPWATASLHELFAHAPDPLARCSFTGDACAETPAILQPLLARQHRLDRSGW